MSQVGEAYITGIPAADITKARQNTRQAVRVDPARSATRGNPAIPVTRVGSGDNVKEVLGEYKQWQSDTAVRIQTKGILHFEMASAYSENMNGQGVQAIDASAGNKGKVEPAGLGEGLGFIIGGYTEDGKEYVIVYVP